MTEQKEIPNETNTQEVTSNPPNSNSCDIKPDENQAEPPSCTCRADIARTLGVLPSLAIQPKPSRIQSSSDEDSDDSHVLYYRLVPEIRTSKKRSKRWKSQVPRWELIQLRWMSGTRTLLHLQRLFTSPIRLVWRLCRVGDLAIWKRAPVIKRKFLRSLHKKSSKIRCRGCILVGVLIK